MLHRNGSLVTLSVSGDEDTPAVAEAVLACGGRLYALTPTRRSLEEIFVQVVTREPDAITGADGGKHSALGTTAGPAGAPAGEARE